MPQGGIDEGENYYDAALRELNEETSIKSVELVKEISKYTTYDLPDRLLGIIWKGKRVVLIQHLYQNLQLAVR